MTPLNKDAIREETLPLMTFIDAANMVQRGLGKRLSPLHLSAAQQRLLALLHLASESLTPSMLAALLVQESHSVSGLLNRLEDRDLITRSRDKGDRRVVWVGLTEEGRKLAQASIEIVLDLSQELAPVLRGPNASGMLTAVRAVRDVGFKMAGVDEETRKEGLRRVWS